MLKTLSRRPFKLLVSFISTLGSCLIVAGAVVAMIGSSLPWATANLVGGITFNVPGFFFSGGVIAGLCGALALIFRRSGVLCLTIAAVLLATTYFAADTIPHTVRGVLIGAQLSVGPINQLLDQFHINSITIGNYGAKDGAFLGEGIARTVFGGELLATGSILSLLSDPTLRRIHRRFAVERCQACASTWRVARDVRYCPNCRHPTPSAFVHCSQCLQSVEPTDLYCVKCGTETLRSRTNSD